MTCRMVPVWQVFDRFPRLVRDAARSLGKQVAFDIDGKEIELDRSMLDEIGDPIVHLLRNAVDHGIEAPDARVAAGKPAEGRLTLSAIRDRSAVLIRVTDDGRGIDRDRVLARARDTGLVDAGTTALSDDEVVRLIARPGFSTAEQVTRSVGAGRGDRCRAGPSPDAGRLAGHQVGARAGHDGDRPAPADAGDHACVAGPGGGRDATPSPWRMSTRRSAPRDRRLQPCGGGP